MFGVDLRLGEQRPNGAVSGDVIFLHGFGDRIDNHDPLFQGWTRAGLRVVAFDYPSHGETTGLLSDLDLFEFTDLAELVVKVEEQTREDQNRPLFLAGWSTGGLLAIRMMQGPTLPQLGRPVAGVIAYAPGVSVYALPGDHGLITLESLTHDPNPPHKGPISPTSPLLKPLFGARLVANALLAQVEPFPTDVPALIFAGGDTDDVYAKTPDLKAWMIAQSDAGANITRIQCAGGRHELDNEAAPMGGQVRTASVDFAAAIVAKQTPGISPGGPCAPF
jgi:alpha-beta hydrolase superfamily lysophospholipase